MMSRRYGSNGRSLASATVPRRDRISPKNEGWPQNKSIDLLEKIEKHYGERVYLSATEVAMLIGISTKTLKKHAAIGNITFSRRGFGLTKVRRSFTAHDVAKFCACLSRDVVVPVPPRRFPRGRAPD